MSAIGERLATLSRGELAGLLVVVVLTLGGVALWYTRSLPRPVEVAVTPGPGSTHVHPSGATGTVSPSVASLIVDVAGWVRRPGVYEFLPGARVIDAVEEAGGARGGADLSLLNLAAPLVDGQQILVPKEGAGTTSGTGVVPGATGGLVNLNTADAATLETLSGVGPALAAAIIQYRTEQGPFTTIDQLDEVSGIGPATLEELRPHVTV
ncbi:MAG TPA: ComEA family DNA-binding protein [Phycicoccus sp.]